MLFHLWCQFAVSVFRCLSLSFSVFLCLSLSFSVFLCLSLSFSLSLSVCAHAGAAARRARSLGDAAVFSPQGGGMLVLGAVVLFCLSGGELQAIKENRKQNRLAQKRRKNLLKADIFFCSCLFLVVVPSLYAGGKEAISCWSPGAHHGQKRRKQLRQERRSPQAPAVAVLGLLGQQSKAALDVCWNCSLPFPPQCNIIIVPFSFLRKHT